MHNRKQLKFWTGHIGHIYRNKIHIPSVFLVHYSQACLLLKKGANQHAVDENGQVYICPRLVY